MRALSVPPNRWPLRLHAAAALLTLAAVALCAWGLLSRARASADTLRAEAQFAQQRLHSLRGAAQQGKGGNYTQALPSSARADEVVRDLGRQAQALGMSISSLSLQPQAASARELGKVVFSVSANADYRGVKTWLAEMLARYPTLAVQTLSLRGTPNDPARLEVQATLALFVKD